jgi:hypothetical protein
MRGQSRGSISTQPHLTILGSASNRDTELQVSYLPNKAALSPNRRRLVEAMQVLNFGRIEQLQIRAGEPVFTPAPRLIQDIKIGSADGGPRPELAREDFPLKASVLELFDHLDRIRDGTVAVVEVRYGLPFRVVVERCCGELS